MALDVVLFDLTPVTVIQLSRAERFLARLFTQDVRKMPVGGLLRGVMMNATGGIIGLPLVARTAQDEYTLLLTGANADAEQAWIRQVSVAFDAELTCETLYAVPYVGNLPVAGLQVLAGTMTSLKGLRFLNLGWMCLAVGPQLDMRALRDNLLEAGAQKGAQTGFDAMRIFAREPAMGLEITEGSSPLETGLEDALDFDDAERIFIGRALTEARAKAQKHLRLQLVAFDVAFDPSLLVEVPTCLVEGELYPLTSIARVPEGPFTVGLVRLPLSVQLGQALKVSVKTDPRTVCEAALVVDRQV